MAKLRRSSACAVPFPVAADVLEVRALLSSAHAAVAAAVHHDAHAAATQSFNGLNFTNTLTCNELGISKFETPGQFKTASVDPTIGGKFSAAWSQKGPFNGSGFAIESIKGKLTGTLNSSFPDGGGVTGFLMTPKSSVTITAKVEGHTFHLKLAQNPGEAEDLFLNSDNSFNHFFATFVLPNKGATHGGVVSLTLNAT